MEIVRTFEFTYISSFLQFYLFLPWKMLPDSYLSIKKHYLNQLNPPEKNNFIEVNKNTAETRNGVVCQWGNKQICYEK